ncbi:hypothetical protein BT69DRAFT_1279948 [Atractiella rhizophila]|nr:hypothetical protein BT69DRAFT_1279948 [Atractiella rhizophila]
MYKSKADTFDFKDKQTGLKTFGAKRVRRIALAAAFPEFCTTKEVDALHDLLDQNYTAVCRRLGGDNREPHRHQYGWKLRAGNYAAVRWAGSQLQDPNRHHPVSPEDYNWHMRNCSELYLIINIVTGAFDTKFAR